MSKFTLLNELSESRLFPSVKSFTHYEATELAELAFLYIIALRILLSEDATVAWARGYCWKTASASGFGHWRTDGTDLYCMLHALTDETTDLEDDANDHIRGNLHIVPTTVLSWLRDSASGHPHEQQTVRFFTRLDGMFRISNSSMRAVRRLVTDWPELPHHEKKLAMTRLLQFVRARAPKGEILPLLTKISHAHDLEIDDVCNLETGENCGRGDSRPQQPVKAEKKKGSRFIAGLLGAAVGVGLSTLLRRESASSGATGAANVATVAGGLGAGFDPKGHKGIYDTAPPMIIRRGAAPKPVKKPAPKKL